MRRHRVVIVTHHGTRCAFVCLFVTSHLRNRSENDSFLSSSSLHACASIWQLPRGGMERKHKRETEIRGAAGVFRFLPLLFPLTSQFPSTKPSVWHFVNIYFLVVLLLWFLGSFQVMRLCFSHLSFISLNSPFISFILSSLSWCFILPSTVSQDFSLGACFTSCNINNHTNNTHFTL